EDIGGIEVKEDLMRGSTAAAPTPRFQEHPFKQWRWGRGIYPGFIPAGLPSPQSESYHSNRRRQVAP
ncbi:MAG TPA: hypothetical protein VI756_31380, partial [Blastocatellia bacterium]